MVGFMEEYNEFMKIIEKAKNNSCNGFREKINECDLSFSKFSERFSAKDYVEYCKSVKRRNHPKYANFRYLLYYFYDTKQNNVMIEYFFDL